MGTAALKVTGGKLLRVRLEHDGAVVAEIMITGDFFLHPEEGLSLLERGLLGSTLGESEQVLAQRIGSIVLENRLTILGFGPADLAAIIKEAGK